MIDTTDQEWFEHQVVGLLDDLLGAAIRLAKNRHDAEDLVADAVTKAWGSRESLKGAERFRPWIFRILTNCFVSDCRKRAVRPVAEVSVDAVADDREGGFSLFEELHQPFLLWWGTPEQEFLNKLLREDLERAVDGLPESYRAVVVLADMEGLAYAEIADSLGVPVGTVRSRLARARAQLQKALWIHARDAGLTKPADTTPRGAHEASEDDRV